MNKSTRRSNIKVGVSYDRVSTVGQVEDENGFRRQDASPEAQRSRCLDHMKFLSQTKGCQFKIIEHVSDEGFSGKDVNRPGFQRMWDLIATRSIDFVVATELSRLSRNVADFLSLVSHCEKNGVDIVVIGLQLDTSSPIGRVLIVILVALAQFEREMTSMRVRENALARLLKDGKINGSAEILGLIKDPNNKGHFLIDEAEVSKLEKILKLFLQVSSKKKLLAAAKSMGLTGKAGRELTQHTIDIILDNVRWRYRGLWYANKENKDADQEFLPENRRYQLVRLPHGPVVDSQLLDEVRAKVEDTYEKKKKTTKTNYTYLLSHILKYEDGTPFSGQPGKGNEYRYYYNKHHNLRLRCEEIESLVIQDLRESFLQSDRFNQLVAEAVKRRQAELPRVEVQIREAQKKVKELETASNELRAQLANPERRSQTGFMDWLAQQVETLSKDHQRAEAEVEALERGRTELLRTSGLDDVQSKAKKLLNRFDAVNGVEKRELIEKLVRKIEVRPENRLRLHLSIQRGGRPLASSSVTLRNQSTGSEGNGGADGTRTRGLPRDRRTL